MYESADHFQTLRKDTNEITIYSLLSCTIGFK